MFSKSHLQSSQELLKKYFWNTRMKESQSTLWLQNQRLYLVPGRTMKANYGIGTIKCRGNLVV